MNSARSILKTSSTTGVIIDVREPKEFSDNHIPGSINLPSTNFQLIQFEPYRDQTICLVCQSGNRAQGIREKLLASGFESVSLLETQMEQLESPSEATDGAFGWSVDRQFRLSLGILLLIFLVGFFSGVSQFIIIPIILCAGLTITSIIDRCYMRMGIAMLPWNRRK